MDASKYLTGSFLRVDDLKESGPIRVRITNISEGQYGKLDVTLDDGDKLSINQTNNRTLVKAYGRETDDWLGMEIELYLGEVKFKGKPQEAILVKPISPTIENNAPPRPVPAPGADDDF
jgi:hypothetical protein